MGRRPVSREMAMAEAAEMIDSRRKYVVVGDLRSVVLDERCPSAARPRDFGSEGVFGRRAVAE